MQPQYSQSNAFSRAALRSLSALALALVVLFVLLSPAARPAAAGPIPDGLTAGDWSQLTAMLPPPAAPAQQGYLKASNAEADDQFGYAVAVDGDTVVAGASLEDGNGTSESDNNASNAGPS